MPSPAELALELTPRRRVDLIDLRSLVAQAHGDLLGRYARALYCSHHTTAGFLPRQLLARLDHSSERVGSLLAALGRVFPQGAGYRHDDLDRRPELSAAQREVEPRNADSHLAFMRAGLAHCVTHPTLPASPVYWIDLDGVSEQGARRRLATVLAYDRDEVVAETELEVPVSSHPIDSVNLRDAGLGLVERLQEEVRRRGVAKGRLDLTLGAEERDAALTVNEYETLLMQHDLSEVLRDPLRFMAEKGRHALRDPLAVPHKAWSYAKYDLVHVWNELIEATGLAESFLEGLLARVMATPASRLFGMRRAVSLLVSDGDSGRGWGSIVQGTYQSPILVQWRKSARGTRLLRARLSRLL
jgi:thiamine phosphate synthase YjbQ (UPF0047 family)